MNYLKQVLLFSMFLFAMVGTSAGEVKSFTTTGDGDGNTSKNPTGTMTDIEGNTYNTVKIGDQWWMAENLKVTKYANGTSIAHITDDSEWGALGGNDSDKAYCFYNNDAGLGYGALYTFAAATNGTPHSGSGHVQGVCPDGWHLPSDSEWTQLENYMIANGYNYDGTTTGNKIGKALASQTGWKSSAQIGTGAVGNNPASNNSSGFNALPGGYRVINGLFNAVGIYGLWWSSSTQGRSYPAYYRALWYSRPHLYRNDYPKLNGFSVRCVKD